MITSEKSEELSSTVVPHFTAVVIGSGFSGLCMGVKLKEAGICDFVILEREARLGGTWRDNDYPGAACDVPGRLYSFSFMQEGGWSRLYPGRDELLSYTDRVAENFDLHRHIRLGTGLLSARYDESRYMWELQTTTGAMTASALITAVGPLSRPAIPKLPGLETFVGKTFHSSRWDHNYDFRKKRVAVIGTGASAVQFIPRIARKVEQLHVFQRTPPWVVPRGDSPVRGLERTLLEKSVIARKLARSIALWKHELRIVAFAKYPPLMRILQRRAVDHIKRQVPEGLWPLVTPQYAMGCKRVLLSDDYYRSLRRTNVELIAEPAAKILGQSIFTPSGVEREVDALIFGTGFDSDNLIGNLEIYGAGGRSIQHITACGLEAYKGITVSGFPNFFMLGGPNTGIGHTSLLLMIEASVNYTIEALKTMRLKRIQSVDVKKAVVEKYNIWVQKSLEGTVWNSGCKSWYLNSQSGKNHIIWPTFTQAYAGLTRKFDLSSYNTN